MNTTELFFRDASSLTKFEHPPEALDEQLGRPERDEDIHPHFGPPSPPMLAVPEQVVLVQILKHGFELPFPHIAREQDTKAFPHPGEARPTEDLASLLPHLLLRFYLHRASSGIF
jgi:hypothetical protein